MTSIEKIYAADVRVGDTLLLDGTVTTTVATITPYFMAYAGPTSKDQVVRTSNPPSQRWDVLHFLAHPVNLIRGASETVTVLR